MSVSVQLYDQALTWQNELDEDETLQVFVDLPDYGWVELDRASSGLGFVAARVRPIKSWDVSAWHEVAFPLEALKAVRKAKEP